MTALTAATGFCARFLVSVLVSFASVRRCSRGARAARPGAVRVARLWVECAERSLSCGLDLPGSGATSGRGAGRRRGAGGAGGGGAAGGGGGGGVAGGGSVGVCPAGPGDERAAPLSL